MKKFILTILSIFIFTPMYGVELQGGVSFDVNSAREYVQEKQVDNINISGPIIFDKNSETQKVVYSYNNNGDVIGITVQYKGEPKLAYIYNAQNQLIYVDKYDKPIDIYPHRGYRYNLKGELVLTSLTVSKKEMFRFDPKGKLIAYSLNGIIYDEKGKKIGTGK